MIEHFFLAVFIIVAIWNGWSADTVLTWRARYWREARLRERDKATFERIYEAQWKVTR